MAAGDVAAAVVGGSWKIDTVELEQAAMEEEEQQ